MNKINKIRKWNHLEHMQLNQQFIFLHGKNLPLTQRHNSVAGHRTSYTRRCEIPWDINTVITYSPLRSKSVSHLISWSRNEITQITNSSFEIIENSHKIKETKLAGFNARAASPPRGRNRTLTILLSTDAPSKAHLAEQGCGLPGARPAIHGCSLPGAHRHAALLSIFDGRYCPAPPQDDLAPPPLESTNSPQL
jgi:hypothetical protein